MVRVNFKKNYNGVIFYKNPHYAKKRILTGPSIPYANLNACSPECITPIRKKSIIVSIFWEVVKKIVLIFHLRCCEQTEVSWGLNVAGPEILT